MRTLLVLALLGMQSDGYIPACIDSTGKAVACQQQGTGIGIVSGKILTVSTDIPKPVWVPDPSAGHYDCPKDWTAYAKEEPSTLEQMQAPAPAVYIAPVLDAKGHVLGSQPPVPICIKDSK